MTAVTEDNYKQKGQLEMAAMIIIELFNSISDLWLQIAKLELKGCQKIIKILYSLKPFKYNELDRIPIPFEN